MTGETFIGVVMPLLIGAVATAYFFYGRWHADKERVRGVVNGQMSASAAARTPVERELLKREMKKDKEAGARRMEEKSTP